MLAALVSVLLLGAPEDAAARVRVAWASLYEWQEHGVENATVDFRYSYERRDVDGKAARYEGHGQATLVGREIVRVHYPAAAVPPRDEVAEHVRWALLRFVRRPFEEEFKDARFEEPEKLTDGLERIRGGGRVFLLQGDRLAGEEWNVGTAAAPYLARITYDTAPMGGGYAIVGHRWSYTRRDVKTIGSREFTFETKEDVPRPKSYVWRRDVATEGTWEVRLDFGETRLNLADPVVVEPAARDALAAAWANRYVLPESLRLRGDFQRKVDKDLAESRWTALVRGSFQVWGMDQIEFLPDEKSIRDERWRKALSDTCETHMRWMLGLMRDRPFDEEFAKCGFAFADGEAVVTVVGYPRALAFRLEDGRIVAYLRNAVEDDWWWQLRLKRVKDAYRIDELATKSPVSIKLRIRYARVKGLDVPRSFEALGQAGDVYGAVEYDLKKLKVDLPD